MAVEMVDLAEVEAKAAAAAGTGSYWRRRNQLQQQTHNHNPMLSIQLPEQGVATLPQVCLILNRPAASRAARSSCNLCSAPGALEPAGQSTQAAVTVPLLIRYWLPAASQPDRVENQFLLSYSVMTSSAVPTAARVGIVPATTAMSAEKPMHCQQLQRACVHGRLTDTAAPAAQLGGVDGVECAGGNLGSFRDIDYCRA